jgi:hypothetical protein
MSYSKTIITECYNIVEDEDIIYKKIIKKNRLKKTEKQINCALGIVCICNCFLAGIIK